MICTVEGLTMDECWTLDSSAELKFPTEHMSQMFSSLSLLLCVVSHCVCSLLFSISEVYTWKVSH